MRNHVIILPVDDLSNAASVAVANQIKGAMALPHPYAGCSSALTSTCTFSYFDRYRSNIQRCGGRRDRDRGSVDTEDRRWHRGHRQVVSGFGIDHGDHDTIMPASKAAREYVQWASESSAKNVRSTAYGRRPSAASRTRRSVCVLNPTVGNAFDKLYRSATTLVFGETTELGG